MTGKQRGSSRTTSNVLQPVFVGTAFLVFALLFVGCDLAGRGSGAKVDKVLRTPAEEKKARLLRQLDHKFENPDAHFELGQLYQADGLWAKAEHEYNTALSFEPAHRRAQAAMVKVLSKSGDANRAELSADIYMNQVSASAEESALLALAFQEQGLDEYALSCWRQGLHLAPNSANINRQIGYYYLSKGNKEQALDYLSRSFQLNPNQPEVAGELGRLGVAIKIPRKTEKSTKRLDKIIDQPRK